MADQVVDDVAAKYGGVAVAAPPSGVDPTAAKYGGTIDPVAAKFGGERVAPEDLARGPMAPGTRSVSGGPAAIAVPAASGAFTPAELDVIGRAAPTQQAETPTYRLPAVEPPPEFAPAQGRPGSAKTGGVATQPPLGQGLPFLDEIPLGAAQAAGGAQSLFDVFGGTVKDALQHPAVVSPEPHLAPQGGNPDAALTAVTAGNEILEGGFKALSPLVYAGAVINPVATAAALVGAWAGNKAVQTGATALGASEPVSRFAGNLAALLTGSLAAHVATKGTFGTPEEAAAKTATDAEAAQVAAAARKAATDTLGVPANADADTIRTAYRAAARANHPDVGGDVATMADLNLAYEWLEDHPGPAVNTPPTVTLSGWIKEQAAWLRSKFPSRSANAADRANPPAPSSEGRALEGAVDPDAAKFGGQPVDEAALPTGEQPLPPGQMSTADIKAEFDSLHTKAKGGTVFDQTIGAAMGRPIPSLSDKEHARWQALYEELRLRKGGRGASDAATALLYPNLHTPTEEQARQIEREERETKKPPSVTSSEPTTVIAPENTATPATDVTSPIDPVAEQFGGVPSNPVATPGARRVAASKTPENPPVGGAPKYSVLSTLDDAHREAMRSALGSFEGGESRWNELRLRGATDKQILEQAGQEFGLGGSASMGAGVDYKGGKNPQLTLGTSGGGQRLKLQGPKLAATIREMVGIPPPVQTIGGKAVAPERPVGFWELHPDELQARIGFDITKPWETGANATSTREELTAFSNKLIDNVLRTVGEKGVDALPEVQKVLRSVEHLRDHSDPSDYDYTWDVEPFVRTIPELDRIVKRLEGQHDLPIERPDSGPVTPPPAGMKNIPAAKRRAVQIPEGLEETRDYADVQAWAKAEAEKTGETVDAVLKAHELPDSAEAFAKWIYPATPGTKVPGAAPKPGEPVDVKAVQRAWSNRERPPQTETALVSAVPDGQDKAFYRTLATHYDSLEKRTRPLATPSFDGDRMNRIADQWKAAADRAKLHLENAVSETAPLKPEKSAAPSGDDLVGFLKGGKAGEAHRAPVQLTDGARAAGEKKLALLERRYGAQSTKHQAAVRNAETPEDLKAALDAAETHYKTTREALDTKHAEETSKKEQARLARQEKAVAKGRELVAAGKHVVWRAVGYTDKSQDVWEPMEGSAVTLNATLPEGLTFSAFKDPSNQPATRWMVVEDSTGRTLAKGASTKAGAIANAEEVVRGLKPGAFEKALEAGRKRVGPKPDLTAAADVDETAAKYGGEKIEPETAKGAESTEVAPRSTSLPTRAFDVLVATLKRNGISEPFPREAVAFRKWIAEQLDVPLEQLTENIDVINDAAEAALAKHLRTEADTESLELAFNQAQNYEDLLPRAHRTLEKSKLQQFSTPLPIGLLAGHAAQIEDGDRVLEPTAGTGSLLVGVPDAIPVTAIELAPRRVDLLRAAGVNAVQADYLTYPAGKAKPTVIISNPPWGKYSTGKYGKGVAMGFGPTDVAERFVGKMLRDLADGGRLVAVMPTTMLNSPSFKNWLKAKYTVQAIIQAPPGAYDTRSTGVNSLLLVVDNLTPAAGAALPKTVVTADWQAYREAVEAIPERAQRPEAVAVDTPDRAASRPGAQPRAGRPARTEPASGRPARPEPRRDAAVGAERPADVVAEGRESGRPASKPAGEFTQRLSGPSHDARAAAGRSTSFAPYTRRTALRGLGHPKLVVEARQLAGVDYPPLTYTPHSAIADALAGGRVSVEQAEQAIAAVQANVVGHHGYLAADAVGVGKSREIALTILEAMQHAAAAKTDLRLIITTKSRDNIADLIDREMYYVATGRTKDGTDLANPGAEKVKPEGLPFEVEVVTDRPNAKKFGTKEYEPLPVHTRGIYVIDSFNLASYAGALEDVGAHGIVGDEAHRFKNVEGAAVGGAWQRLHALILRDVPRPQQFFAYFTATPAQQVEDYAYLYGLRLWPVDGFSNWLEMVTGGLSEAAAKELAEATERGAIDMDRVAGNATDAVIGGDGENASGKKKKYGVGAGRDAFTARLTPTEGEQIPREWKMLGRFSARDLWRDGTEFQIHEAKLSKAHQQKYDQFVDLAQDIIETAAKYGTMDKSGKANRFGVTGLLQFAAKRIQMQPAIEEAIALAKNEVATGHQVVLSLINVSEMNDQRGHLTAAIDKINTRLVDADPDDPDGGFQDLGEIPEALVDQARLRDRVRDLGTFDDPLQMVEDAVGKENVAFITGGTGATRQLQVAEFQAGKRDYAVLSAAGSTGINLDHRIKTATAPGHGRRVFIDVQYEWSATEALQRYGRVDRASSITPPKIKALTFGNASEKKFLATIANRMAALGALSKGGAESTGGASALEEFEITGDDALAAARKAYEELPREGKTQFARVKSVFRDPNRETKPDMPGYNPYAPKPSASGTVMQDFQLPLLFMPLADSNAFWKRFIELRDEIREQTGSARANRTERFTGQILETATLKPNLMLYQVKNDAGQKFGILAGLVTQELPKLRQALAGGEFDESTGRYETGLTRRYVTFSAGDQVVTGLQIKWGRVRAVADLYEHHLQGETLDTPAKVLEALKAGEKLPLQEKNPDSGKPWTIRYRASDKRIPIDNARMADRALLLRHGADYSPVGNYWHVTHLEKFLDRFPLAEHAETPKKLTPPKPSSGGTTLQSTVLPGAAEFFEQDVLPGLKSTADAFAQAAAQLQHAVAPATVGKGAQAAGSLRAMMAGEAQENARMMAAAAAFQTQFDKLLATSGGRDQAIDWWDAVQLGKPTAILPELKPAYDYMRRALDEERIEIQKYGKLDEFNEFYFPQIWKFPKQEAAWVRRKIAGLMGKRPFEGSKGFLKQRKYPTFREGLAALTPKGVEPISYNPVDHFLVKMREMRRYRVARAAIKDFETLGIWKAFRGTGVKPPEGWTRVDGPLGTIYGRPTVSFKEAYDPDLFEGLERFARSLGVRLQRRPNIGGTRWGYAVGDRDVTTKAAGPEGVLMHELGHILDERYHLRGMVNDKKFKTELRALADLRHEGADRSQVRPGFLRYIRKGEEKIANLVHAFLYAPERAKKLAPNAFWALYNLAKAHPELRPLLKLQKTRSLKLGVRSHDIDIGGFPEIGFYAMPDDAARIFNNHLSRGLAGESAIYDSYRWLNNSMVTGQLAASGLFHATFTGLNALASEGGLALQELTLGAQTGDWSLVGKGATRLAVAGALGTAGAAAGFALGGPAGVLWATGYPIAGLKFVKGWRAQKEWLTKDPAGRFFADHVRQMQEGGFRPTWDQFYDNGAMKNAIRALKAGNYPGALARTIPAALDALSAPIMRWLVPGVKTAAYLDAAAFELDRLAQHVTAVEGAERELANLPQSPRERAALTKEQHAVLSALEAQRADHLSVIREALNKVQASIDNRFGEVVYDNWFWKRWLKDLTHITFRSPGWQFGTYKEVGGAFTSQGGILAKRVQAARGKGTAEKGADPEALLSAQMAWLLALLGMTMLMGGMTHYLSTGEKPQGRDWIFPKGPDGKRRAIPTYLRTIVSAYLHPVRTAGSITAPLNTMLYRLLVSNETYSGETIREPGDPFLKQAWDALRLVGSEGYQPFVASNIARGQSSLESVMGVAPAAAELQRGAAENYLHDVLPPSPPRTHEEQAHLDATRRLRSAIQEKDPAAAAKAAQEGGLSRRSVMAGVKSAARDSLVRAFERATLSQAIHAYELATPDERLELRVPLVQKWHRLFPAEPPAEKAAIAARFSTAFKLPVARPPAAAAR